MHAPIRSHSIFVVVLAAVAGCAPGGGSVRPPDARPGHIVVERVGEGRLLDAPARATYCTADSVLVIIALGERWGVGLALRGEFPPGTARALAVRRAAISLEPGSASLALRAAGDSVERAIVASRGTLTLDTLRRASGRFDATAAPAGGQPEVVRVVGAFRALPTTDTAAACGAAPRNP